jgi:hypothetical protein
MYIKIYITYNYIVKQKLEILVRTDYNATASEKTV